jgi:MoaA/NifB/PqqE/SkfB family radical SAM enzyme
METHGINNFWSYENVNAVHMELSTICNAACPGCQRFESNSPIVKSSLVERSVSIDEFKSWFDIQFLKQVKYWTFCGTYGDPLAAKDIYKILEYICQNSNSDIQLNTNGGLRTEDLFKQIGTLFANKPAGVRREITFSIDGLKDTNHIYRRNVSWDKVWKNLMAYVSTGADATWDYLQFKHNAHQVAIAKDIAREHKISFLPKNPFGVDKKAMPVYDKELKLDYVIEHATDNGYPTYIPAQPGYVAPFPEKIVAEGCITCYSKRSAPWPKSDQTVTEIYVDAEGKILPCCFVAVGMVGGAFDWGIQVQELQKQLGDKNNLNYNSVKDILDSGVMNVWSDSWEEKTINVCWQYCGKATEKSRVIDNLWANNEQV